MMIVENLSIKNVKNEKKNWFTSRESLYDVMAGNAILNENETWL